MPEDIDLIVAVSYGKFIPERILKRAKYGGLNIHPSMLPEYITTSLEILILC